MWREINLQAIERFSFFVVKLFVSLKFKFKWHEQTHKHYKQPMFKCKVIYFYIYFKVRQVHREVIKCLTRDIYKNKTNPVDYFKYTLQCSHTENTFYPLIQKLHAEVPLLYPQNRWHELIHKCRLKTTVGDNYCYSFYIKLSQWFTSRVRNQTNHPHFEESEIWSLIVAL